MSDEVWNVALKVAITAGLSVVPKGETIGIGFYAFLRDGRESYMDKVKAYVDAR